MSRLSQKELDQLWMDGLCAYCREPYEARSVEHVYCSDTCRRRDRREAERPEAGRCESCSASLSGRRRDARWCSDACRMRAKRSA